MERQLIRQLIERHISLPASLESRLISLLDRAGTDAEEIERLCSDLSDFSDDAFTRGQHACQYTHE